MWRDNRKLMQNRGVKKGLVFRAKTIQSRLHLYQEVPRSGPIHLEALGQLATWALFLFVKKKAIKKELKTLFINKKQLNY